MVTALTVALGAILAIGAAVPHGGRPSAARAIPDEPRVQVLTSPVASTLQAVAADLDGDGVREVLRLGAETSRVVAEAWRLNVDGTWIRTPRLVLTDDPGFARDGAALRLLVRSVNGTPRVTLVRQPGSREEEDEPCCFTLDDLRMTGTGLALVPVSDPQPSADAISAIDLDGDATDELLATRSLPPLGGVSYPTEARVYRWSADGFMTPTTTQLQVGSGDTPFVLGDTDDVPGEEAGIIATAGRRDFYRLSAEDGDHIRVEAAGLVVTDALAVPIGSGRGLAVIGLRGFGLVIWSWPRRGSLEPLNLEANLPSGRLLGVAGESGPRLMARTVGGDTIEVNLDGLSAEVVGPRPPDAIGAISEAQLRPFAGPVPGGGPDGAPAVIADGRLHAGSPSSDIARLAGVQPVGFVGPDRAWLALLHAPSAEDALDARGGRLTPASFAPNTMLVVAPAEVALTPEADGGALSPAISSGSMLDDGRLAVSGDPFILDVWGPPASRAFVGDGMFIAQGLPDSIGAAGTGHLVIPHPGQGTDRTVAVTVVTPAGHTYRAEWRLLVLRGPPDLTATTETPLGSDEVLVRGRTAPYASVSVGGIAALVDDDGRFSVEVQMPPWPTTVSVVARDPVGNEATRAVTGIGVFDYRALPWIPIAVALVAFAAVLFYVRVPRLPAAPRPVTDDATLEELDPDGDS